MCISGDSYYAYLCKSSYALTRLMHIVYKQATMSKNTSRSLRNVKNFYRLLLLRPLTWKTMPGLHMQIAKKFLHMFVFGCLFSPNFHSDKERAFMVFQYNTGNFPSVPHTTEDSGLGLHKTIRGILNG